MNPPLHNRPGQSLPAARQGAHVPPLPLPSLSFSTTTTIFSLVPPDPETSPNDAAIQPRSCFSGFLMNAG